MIDVHRISGFFNGFIEPIGFFNGCIESIGFFGDVDGSIASNSSIDVKKRYIYMLSLLFMRLFFRSFVFYINGIGDDNFSILFKLVNSFLNPYLFNS